MARTRGRRNRGGAAEGGNQWRAEMCEVGEAGESG